MQEIAISKNNVPIRFTDERWVHIIENHDDLAGFYDDILATIEEPDYIIEGYGQALIALKEMKRRKILAVVYKEITGKDGFVITAYFTTKLQLEKETVLWQKK